MNREQQKALRKIGCKIQCNGAAYQIVNRCGLHFTITRTDLAETGFSAWYNEIYRTSNIQE